MSSFGWAGKILRVNLSTGKITVEPTKPYAEKVIGGRGIGQWILFHELEPSTEPVSAENKVVLSVGPLVGTLVPGACRLSVDFKNPQTGGVGSANAGGHFAPELKFAGFDAVIIEGQATKPVFLSINNDKVKIMDASHIWGKTTWETEDLLRRQIGDKKLRVASIGPAGENLVWGACLVVDRGRGAGRGGSGAVLGAKKLKAITVRGTRPVQIKNPDIFIERAKICWRKMAASSAMNVLRKGGTIGVSVPKHVRNGQFEDWPAERFDRIRWPAWNRFEVSRLACFNCPVYCSHFYEMTEGPYARLAGEGVEANTIRAFGTNLEIDYPPAIFKLSTLCNQLGIDIDFAGAVLGWAFESYQRDLVSIKDTNGLELVWGNYKAAIKLLEDVAYQRGWARVLAKGVKHAAQSLGEGSERWALHIKGADINESGLRYDKAWALGIAIANRGGGHLEGAPLLLRLNTAIAPEISNKLFGVTDVGPINSYEHKEKMVFWQQKLKGAFDVLGICFLLSQWYGLDALGVEDLAPLFESATGRSTSAEELMLYGQRIHNIEKAFNTLHTDISRKDDYPPIRFMRERIESGPFAGEVIHQEEWDNLLSSYYAIQDWDPETGLQQERQLHNLGLDSIAEKLTSYGKLK
jgi:aldehyde:ferredoxin oxidoreductase